MKLLNTVTQKNIVGGLNVGSAILVIAGLAGLMGQLAKGDKSSTEKNQKMARTNPGMTSTEVKKNNQRVS